MIANKPGLAEQLADIVSNRAELIAGHAWPFETARLTELVAAFLHQRIAGNPLVARRLADTLEAAGLLRTQVLAEPSDDARAAIRFMLENAGRSSAQATDDLDILRMIGVAVRDRFHGHLQSFVRRHAETLREELVEAFDGSGEHRPEIYAAVTHWLQNAFNLPIMASNAGVRGFSAANGTTVEDLVSAADEIGLNVAVLDDLLDASVAALQDDDRHGEAERS